jgi:hypothetical protein
MWSPKTPAKAPILLTVLLPHTLGTNLESLTLRGSTAINNTGNTLANFLAGNSVNNTLSGDTGNDTYIFGWGGAADIIVDTDSTSGNTDVLSFLQGIAHGFVMVRARGPVLFKPSISYIE